MILLDRLFTKQEQSLVIFVLTFGLFGMLIHTMAIDFDKKIDKREIKRIKPKKIELDLNVVSKDQLMLINGIGDKMANNIINYRNNYGFSSIEDLKKVKGIGENKYNRLKEYFAHFGSVIEKKRSRININSATLQELITLKGIGLKKGKAIIELRKRMRGFSSINDIVEVKGIGKKTLNRISNNLYLGTYNGKE